jgi:hypothetical protein
LLWFPAQQEPERFVGDGLRLLRRMIKGLQKAVSRGRILAEMHEAMAHIGLDTEEDLLRGLPGEGVEHHLQAGERRASFARAHAVAPAVNQPVKLRIQRVAPAYCIACIRTRGGKGHGDTPNCRFNEIGKGSALVADGAWRDGDLHQVEGIGLPRKANVGAGLRHGGRRTRRRAGCASQFPS